MIFRNPGYSTRSVDQTAFIVVNPTIVTKL